MGELESQNREMMNILESNDAFIKLQDTVVQLSCIMLSKKNESLDESQRTQLRSLFGNQAVMQKIRANMYNGEESLHEDDEMLV